MQVKAHTLSRQKNGSYFSQVMGRDSSPDKLSTKDPTTKNGGDSDEGEGGEGHPKGLAGDLDDAEEEDEQDGEHHQQLGHIRSWI